MLAWSFSSSAYVYREMPVALMAFFHVSSLLISGTLLHCLRMDIWLGNDTWIGDCAAKGLVGTGVQVLM